MTTIPRIKNGHLLIAEPFLGDSNFERSVVLLCEHDANGTFGLVLNQTTKMHLADVIEDDVYPDIPLFLGGPVAQNTLHFIHRRPDLIEHSTLVTDKLYWGGDFEQIKRMLNVGSLPPNDIRFFVGYSGWSPGQLDDELKQNSWIVTRTSSEMIFDSPVDQLWRSVLRAMGGEYKVMSHYPTDPRLN
ncbi:MAG: YqgE/AlgH family protein [Spirosomataceae bacterium]